MQKLIPLVLIALLFIGCQPQTSSSNIIKNSKASSAQQTKVAKAFSDAESLHTSHSKWFERSEKLPLTIIATAYIDNDVLKTKEYRIYRSIIKQIQKDITILDKLSGKDISSKYSSIKFVDYHKSSDAKAKFNAAYNNRYSDKEKLTDILRPDVEKPSQELLIRLNLEELKKGNLTIEGYKTVKQANKTRNSFYYTLRKTAYSKLNKKEKKQAIADSIIATLELSIPEYISVDRKKLVNTGEVYRFVTPLTSDTTKSTVWLYESNNEVAKLENKIDAIVNKNRKIKFLRKGNSGTKYYASSSNSNNGYSLNADGKDLIYKKNQKVLRVIEDAHDSYPIKTIISNDGKFGLSHSYYGQIKYWDLVNGKEIFELQNTTSVVLSSIAISYDGKLCASVDMNGKMTLWNLKTGKDISRYIGKSIEGKKVCKLKGRRCEDYMLSWVGARINFNKEGTKLVAYNNKKIYTFSISTISKKDKRRIKTLEKKIAVIQQLSGTANFDNLHKQNIFTTPLDTNTPKILADLGYILNSKLTTSNLNNIAYSLGASYFEPLMDCTFNKNNKKCSYYNNILISISSKSYDLNNLYYLSEYNLEDAGYKLLGSAINSVEKSKLIKLKHGSYFYKNRKYAFTKKGTDIYYKKLNSKAKPKRLKSNYTKTHNRVRDLFSPNRKYLLRDGFENNYNKKSKTVEIWNLTKLSKRVVTLNDGSKEIIVDDKGRIYYKKGFRELARNSRIARKSRRSEKALYMRIDDTEHSYLDEFYSISNNNKYIVFRGDYGAVMGDIHYAEISTTQNTNKYDFELSTKPTAMAVDNSATLFAVGTENSIQIINLKTKAIIKEFKNTEKIIDIRFDEKRKLIFALGVSNNIYKIDIENYILLYKDY
jgi:hypothetical protein